MGKRKTISRVLSWLLTLAMVFTLVPSDLAFVTVNAEEVAAEAVSAENAAADVANDAVEPETVETDTTITIHYQPDALANWTKCYAQLGGGTGWTALENYGFMKSGFGGVIAANDENDGWFSFKVTLTATEATTYETEGLNGLFNCGTWGGSNQSKNFNVKYTVGADNSFWLKQTELTEDEEALACSTTKPEGWTDGEVSEPTEDTITEYTNVKLYFVNPGSYTTPVINAWSDVTVTADENIAVTGWSGTYPKMLKDENTGYYYATLEAKTTGTISGVQIVDAETATKIEFTSDQIATLNAKKGDAPVSLYYAYGTIYDDPEDIPTTQNYGTATITVHYKNDNGWEKVGSCFGEGDSWNAIAGYEYCKSNAGALLEENSKNTGWYSYKFELPNANSTSVINGQFNDGSWDNKTDTYNIPITGSNVEVWITGTSPINVSTEKPSGWQDGAEVNAPIDPASLISYISPEVRADGSVVIRLDTNDSEIPAAYKNLKAGELFLMGTVTDWSAGVAMDYEDGVFSLVINAADGSGIQVTPGTYEYKFKTATGTWFTDPVNEEKTSGNDPNSILKVPGVVIEGQDLAGAGSTKYTATGSYDEITSWTVSVSENSMVPFEGLTITPDEDNKTATVTADETAESGWYYVTVNYKDNSVAKSQTFAFYHTKRALIYEYEYKEDSEYQGKSDLYAWYNAAKSNVGYNFVPVGTSDKIAAYVPIDDKTISFGYIVRNYAAWGDNDREFTDRTLEFNDEERYIKVQGGEGIEKPYMLSTGKTGYNNGSIIFRYRDDQLFYDGAMDTIKSAKLMLKAPDEELFTAYDMTYSEKDEVFTYELANDNGLAGGEYQFYYAVEFTKGTTTNVSDLYYVPETPVQAGGVDVAVIEYQHYDYDITAKVTPENGANYDENPVVSLSVTRQEGEEAEVNALENGEISAIKADLTELGYARTTDISAITGKGVLYIAQSVTAGTKSVPITLEDIYGNTYEITADVKVVGKSTKDHDWDESVIYFLLTDRFYDGDTSNNYNVDKSVREDYHGGDFKGLTEKMDYIADLGVNTIWITPIVDNIESFQSDETNTLVGGYAGYWACDFTKLDEHLGTQEEFDAMLDKAHEKGIKVMLDVVVNHAGYDKDEEKEWNHADSPFKGMIRPLKEAGADSITQWLSDLPDFMTEDQVVRAQLIEWQKAWATYETKAGNGVDYFRIDTVKHVDHETWSQLKSEICETNPSFKMIGEYFGASYSNTGDYLANGQMDSLLDFDFKAYAKNFVEGSIDSVEKNLETRNAAIDNSVTMGQFLSSHDENGFLNSVGGDTSKMKVAAALELTAKGQPIIYYGEEINLTGDTQYGSDKNNRYDMQFDNLSAEQKAMLSHYKKLIAARNAKTDVFAKGNRTKIAGSDAEKYLVFKRSYGSDYAYVALNTTNEAKKVTFDVSENVTAMTDLYSGQDVSVSGGKVTVTIPANGDGGTVILVASTKKPQDDKKEPKPTQPTQPTQPSTPETPAPKAVGTSETLSDVAAKVVVTSADPANPTVEYVETTDTKATKVQIPDTVAIDGVTYKVTKVADNAFKKNKKVKTVVLGANITEIGKNAFYGCTKLKTVKLNANLEKIGSSAFRGCTAITGITIPVNVTEIGSKAFYGCKKLKKITIKSTVLKKVGSSAFKGIKSTATIKVPKKQLKTYQKLLKKKGQASTVKIKK